MAGKRWATTNASTPEKFGIMFLRLIVGAVFLIHGYQKWFVWKPAGTVAGFHSMGFPPTAAYVAMTAELVCGGLLVLGLLTRLAAIPIVATMAVAVLEVHLKEGFYAPRGYEYSLSLGVAALALIFTGPGAFAADRMLSSK